MKNENDPKNVNANTESRPTVENENLARSILDKLSIHSANHLDKSNFDLCVDMVSEMISKSQSSPKINEKIPENQLADEVRLQAARADAYKWGYDYLQDRMESVQRMGWAHDCDSEIEYRISRAKLNDASAELKPQDTERVEKESKVRVPFRRP